GLVGDEVTELAVAGGGADRHAVHRHALVAQTAAMDRERAQIEIVRTAVVRGPAHPWDQECEIRVVPPSGNRIEDILSQDSLLSHALDVDDRRISGHRDRLL